MIPHESLLKSAAGQIDELDGQIKALNDAKKDVYDNIRETVAPEDFKAWKEAVKLRQKRAVNRDKIEAHENRVAEMLFILEAPTPQKTRERAAAPVSVAAKALPSDEAPTRAGAGAGEVEELPDIPPHMDRRKPKPEYTPEQLLGSG